MESSRSQAEVSRTIHVQTAGRVNQVTGSIGLGDTIAKFTSAIGIKPCGGCKKRQAALNKRFPYKGKK